MHDPPFPLDDPWNGLLEQLPVGLMVSYYPTDDPADGYLIAANPAASRMIGVDLSNFIEVAPATSGVDDRFDAEETAQTSQLAFDVAMGGMPIVLDDFVVEHGSAQGHYQVTIFSLPGRRAASVFRRTDREAAAAEALDWAMNALETSNESLANFASTVAHDLKNPLGGISGNAELVKMMAHDLPSDAAEPLERIIELASHSASMIDGLLSFAKAPSSTSNEAVDLRATLEWATHLLDHEISQAGATIVIDGDAVVTANEAALRQVVLNVIANSLRYLHHDRLPSIRVVVETVESRVTIRIADNGVGIETDMQARVFEWGFRNDERNMAPTGSGLGLAASRVVLESLGGTIDIGESTTQGTTMVICLPAHRGKAEDL